MLLGDWFGYDKQIAKFAVHPLGDVAGKLQVLRLVVANWHVGGAVEQDIGGHQDWVVEETDGDISVYSIPSFLFVRHFLPGYFTIEKLTRFVFELCHYIHSAKPSEAIQNPC